MSLSAINSQYLGLNGLSTMGGFTGATGIANDGWADTVKNGVKNQYEISATTSSYNNKGTVSSSSFQQQCQTIKYLLEDGRTDDAMKKFNDLYQDMKTNEYYAGYSENEIKTLLQEKYMEATGATIISDIDTKAPSDFTSGFVNSIPLVGFLFPKNSGDEFIAEVTGTETSGFSKVKKGAGAVTATGLAAGAGALAASLMKKGSKAAKIAGAIIGGGAALLTFITGKAASNV